MNAITCDDLVFRRGDRTVLNRIEIGRAHV